MESKIGGKRNSPNSKKKNGGGVYHPPNSKKIEPYLGNKCINVLNHSHLIMRNINRRNAKRWASSFRN